ncbi:hypothetical protein BSL78_00575 [Apostichopus japonicus]|uniref:Uncharacterized protein n=1 Tax=Stichopus japonicus TaxID=307972 RepID=A0A2G8LQE4_STIJA|nr:hypothetical protein BSL78_00575 [Apostichopus japonicus]
MSVQGRVDSFSVKLKELPRNMLIFSRGLRSLYEENAVEFSSHKAFEINNIRDQTRRDAVVYMKKVLPLSSQMVRAIEEYFDDYEKHELTAWKCELPCILQKVNGYQQCCTEVIRMYEDMMVPLKKRQDEAKVLISELEVLNNELIKRKQALEKEAANSRGWAFGLAFVPGVNLIASPLLSSSANSDMAKAAKEAKQVEINKTSAFVVSDSLIPALSAFLDGLNAVAGFFNIMKEELTAFHSKGERAKRLHYNMMKKKAVEMKGSCKEFYAMIRLVQTDMQCIEEKPMHLSFFSDLILQICKLSPDTGE